MVALNETEAEALDSLVAERAEKIRADREQAEAAEQAAIERGKALKSLKRQAVVAVKARNELIPQFLEALANTAELAKALKSQRDAYQQAVGRAIRMGSPLDTQYPKAFAIDPAEREALRTALTQLQDIGGRV